MDKQIKRVDGEYDVYVNNEYVGSRRTYQEAEALVNETAYRLLADNRTNATYPAPAAWIHKH